MDALSSGVDVVAVAGGVGAAVLATMLVWWALIGLYLIRRLISDQSDV